MGGDDVDFRHICKQYQLFSTAWQCVPNQLECVCIQSFYSSSIGDGSQGICPIVSKSKQPFRLYLPGNTLWSMGKDLCISLLFAYTNHADGNHPVFTGTSGKCDVRVEYSNYHCRDRISGDDLFPVGRDSGRGLDRCHTGNHHDFRCDTVCHFYHVFYA